MMIVSMFTFVSCGDDTPDTPVDPVDPVDPADPTDPADPVDPVDPVDPGTEEPAENEDQKKADKVIERINKIEELTAENWDDMENKIKYARKYYDELTDAQKALIDAELVKKMTDAEAAFAVFAAAAEKAEGLTINKIVKASPFIDCVLEGYYVMGAALKLDNATLRFVYDKTYLYVYANVAGTDAVTLQLACNAALASKLTINADGVKDANGAALSCSFDSAAIEGGYVAEAAIPLETLGLEDDNFEDKEVGVTFACGNAKYAGFDALDDCERFYTADASRYNYISTGTPTIDGEIDELYLTADPITLSQPVVKGFTSAETKLGGGWQGDTTLTDAADMHTTFRFSVDDKYLYIVEHRLDMYPLYTAPAYKNPYRGDGSLLWFAKDDTLGAGIQWNRALKEYAGPQFGLFYNDGQSAGALKNWEFAVKQYGTMCEYVLEVKVPLMDLELTREDFEAGRVSFTFCSADVVNPSYDPTVNAAWDGNGYQMNYVGVNTWKDADGAKTAMPVLLINDTDTQMGEMPEFTGEYAPEHTLEFDVWDPQRDVIPKPFEDFPVDAATGFVVPNKEWTIDHLMDWYKDDYANSTSKYNFTRTRTPEYAEGISLIENKSSWNNSGFYCDPIGSNVTVTIDLTKYKDALIIFGTGGNNLIEISTDNENWTEVYNHLKVNETPVKDTVRYGIALDTTIFAPGAETIHLRIGQAKTDAAGYGGALSGLVVYYN